jgi:CBS domain containing-hemolysin-like protein
MSDNLPTFFALTLYLLLSFLLSGMEAGVFALNRLRVRRLARAGNPKARRLHSYLEKPEKFLWTILVGNTVVNFLILGWVITKLHEWFTGQVALNIVLFALFVFVFYAFFDLLPKMLFRAYPNRLCLSMANIFRFVMLVFSPLVLAVAEISKMVLRWKGSEAFTGRLFGNREEMRAVMQEAAQALSGDEHAMINRVLDLQHFTVGRIHVPLEKTLAVQAGAPLREAIAMAREKNISRFPVWEMRDGQRRIGGLVDVGALLYQENLAVEKPAAEFMSPALFIDEDMRVEVALRRLQRAGQRLAIVLARDRSEIGVVALEDILKLMFGEVKL